MTSATNDLCFLPATELAQRIRRRDLSPVEVTETHLRRIEARNSVLNAFTLVLADAAMEAARKAEQAVMAGGPLGALHGVPVAIKDLDDVAGVPTSMGSRAVLNRVPQQSATIVERMLGAGAIVLGKTNVPEFGHKGITDNLRFGPTSTPYAIGYNAGGSSGGSAAAVADGMAPLAQGTDGGGFIRIPAALSGAVGFKASFGRIPSVTRPDGRLWGHPLVQIGPLTRTVGDAALMTAVTAGPHPRDIFSLPESGIDYVAAATRPLRNPRIAFAPRLGNFPVDPRVARVVADAVAAMRTAGLAVDERELDFKADHYELSLLWVRTIAIHYAAIAKYWKDDGLDLLANADALTPQFRSMLTDYNHITAVEHSLDDVLRTQVQDGLEDVFEDYDFIVSPTLAAPAIKNATDGNTIGPAEIEGRQVEPLIGWCMTYPINFTGHPAISVPAGLTPEGYPVGLQIIGRRFADDAVLALAGMYERLRPWLHTYPGFKGLDLELQQV